MTTITLPEGAIERLHKEVVKARGKGTIRYYATAWKEDSPHTIRLEGATMEEARQYFHGFVFDDRDFEQEMFSDLEDDLGLFWDDDHERQFVGLYEEDSTPRERFLSVMNQYGVEFIETLEWSAEMASYWILASATMYSK